MDDDDRSLDRLIRAAGGGFDPSPDLPERIGQRVRQRQARRRMAVSVGAVMVVAAIVGGGLRLAAQDGPGDELRTASDDRLIRGPSSTSSTTTSPTSSASPPTDSGSTTTSAPPTTMVPDGGSPTIYALRGPTPDSPRQLVEIDLATGQLQGEVIPLEGMSAVVSRGDEEWWVRRGPLDNCNFSWEEHHAVGAGGFAFPEAIEAAFSPDGLFLAYVQTIPGACEGAQQLIVRDLRTGAEAITTTLVNGGNLTWSPDSSDLAYETDESPVATGDESIQSVSVSTQIVAGGQLTPLPILHADQDCSVSRPSFGPDGLLWYTKACGSTVSIAATNVSDGEAPVDVEVSATDPQWVRSLTVNRLTGQVAFVANDNTAWVLDGEDARPFLDERGQPIVGITDVLWPGN